MSEEYLSDEGIAALGKSELEAYINTLMYFLNHQDDQQTIFDQTSNSIDLSDNMPKLAYGYIDEQIGPLKSILSIIKSNTSAIKDRTIKALLLENGKMIEDFLKGIEDGTTGQKLSTTPDYIALSRELADDIRNRSVKFDYDRPRDLASIIAHNIRENHEHPKEVPSKFTNMIAEGFARFEERRIERERLADSFGTRRRSEELSVQKNPKQYLRSGQLLRDVADKVIRDHQ